MQNSEVTNEAFRKTWAEWRGRTQAACMRWVKNGSADMSMEDLLAVAQQVMLTTMRRLDPNRGKFSTFYYTNLHNRFHRMARRAGHNNHLFRVNVLDKKTNKVEPLSRRFSYAEEALFVARSIKGKRRIASVTPDTHHRRKFIPADRLVPLDSKVQYGCDDTSFTMHDSVGTVDVPTIGVLVHSIRHYVKDRTNRKILLLTAEGYPVCKIAPALGVTLQDVHNRLKRLESLVSIVHTSV